MSGNDGNPSMTIRVNNRSRQVLRRLTHLWCQPEDDQGTPIVFRNLVLVPLPQQFRNRELSPFDPNPRRIADILERHEPAVRGTNNPSGILGLLDGAGVLLEFTVEEFVERLERPERVAHLVNVEVVELDKRRDLSCGSRIVVLNALFDGHRLEEVARPCAFHLTPSTLVQEADAQSNVYLHLFFFQLTSHAVLYDDVGRVLLESLVHLSRRSEDRRSLTAPREYAPVVTLFMTIVYHFLFA